MLYQQRGPLLPNGQDAGEMLLNIEARIGGVITLGATGSLGWTRCFRETSEA
jgi:hypothetical protein